MSKAVTAAYARANLPPLLRAVAAGNSNTMMRDKKPVADPVPTAVAGKPAPQFGTGRNKWKIIDANWAAPTSDEEADAFVAGR
jgi:antitoxin (DNA-binding transcriptional repressor) of toxin-antitoxin stability system